MNAVLDASAAIKIILRQDNFLDFEGALRACEKVFAPSLYFSEVANSLRKYVDVGAIKREGVGEYLEAAIELIDEFVEPRDFIIESLHEAIRLKHSVYDMLYFTLARRNGAALITLDKKLNKLAAHDGITILLDLSPRLMSPPK
jgi:predicted nucleic acid-binding protein